MGPMRSGILDGLGRREFLRLGTLGGVGLTLPQLLHAQDRRATRSTGARSCILFFLEGGPSHIDLWDMKPNAPVEVRGEFQPIATTAPRIEVCDHLPLLAQQMHHVALVRSVHHKVNDHNAGAYYALTGHSPLQGGNLIVGPAPDNFPPYGAVLAKLRPSEQLPPFVHVPEYMSNLGRNLPGQDAGFLGSAYDPFVAEDPSEPDYEVPGVSLPDDVAWARLERRRALLTQVDGLNSTAAERMRTSYERAFTLLHSTKMRDAFDLSREPDSVRQRYGLPDRTDRSVEARKFGGLPHLGQCMLLARRLVEAGVRLVTVCSGRRIDQAWDTHRQHFPLLKQSLLPYADRAFAMLLADLSERGLLDETLVVAMGEFGRTPKLGQITSGAGATANGRDHWPHCYSVLFAGGGVRGGTVYGASDGDGAYPLENAVTPADIAATIYHALGVDPEMRIRDSFGRPHTLSSGRAISELFA